MYEEGLSSSEGAGKDLRKYTKIILIRNNPIKIRKSKDQLRGAIWGIKRYL